MESIWFCKAVSTIKIIISMIFFIHRISMDKLDVKLLLGSFGVSFIFISQ